MPPNPNEDTQPNVSVALAEIRKDIAHLTDTVNSIKKTLEKRDYGEQIAVLRSEMDDLSFIKKWALGYGAALIITLILAVVALLQSAL